MQNNLIQLFPLEKREFWKTTAMKQEQIQEIRLRLDRPVVVIWNGYEFFLDKNGELMREQTGAYQVSDEELTSLLNHICHYSPYAFEDEIRQGFITVAGGHRVGIAGQVVMDGRGGVRTMKHISYLNIRVAHQIKGAADKVLPFVYENGIVKNTLIISPPGCGKTTLLRDLIRQISDGNPYGKGVSVGVVDERSEIAGSYLGVPQNDIGTRTDVLDACPKVVGMMLLLRSMAPRVVAIDEIGGMEDMEALLTAASCGCSILATIHGNGLEDYRTRLGNYRLPIESLFSCILILGKQQGKPMLQKIYGEEEIYAAFTGGNYDCQRLSGNGDLVSGKLFGASGGIEESGENYGTAGGRNQIWQGNIAGML